ncbi:MAG: hypothetical protein GX643_04570 [Acidimicrobiales bacterium]|nr:hypothetical protein [Acidimicrobiales bacterium]
MAQLSFRDRFFSPPVARALTSPSGILSFGAGAAVGIVATAPVSVPLAAVGAVVGGVVGLGARIAVALPRNSAKPSIDAFAVQEPWRHAVLDAIRAQGRFTKAVRTFRDGPLKTAVGAVGDRMDDAVDECWQVAQRGQLLTEARRAINDRETAWELQQAQNALGGNTPNDTQARTIRSLESQLETAARMDALIESTKDRLDLLNARLDESVTRAIELSVSGGQSGVASLDDDVEGIVDELASLRLAIEDLNSPGSAGPSGEPRTARGS